MYGLKQTGERCELLLIEAVLGLKFMQSAIDERLFFNSINNLFPMLVTVVNKLAFVSNSTLLMNHFELWLQATHRLVNFDACLDH